MSDPLLRLALALCLLGGVALLLGPFGLVLELGGLGAVALGIVLAAPAARGPDDGWWRLLAAGEALAALGVALAFLSEPIGGLLILVGAVTVLVTAALRLPSRR